jgi:hypothetical protein
MELYMSIFTFSAFTAVIFTFAPFGSFEWVTNDNVPEYSPSMEYASFRLMDGVHAAKAITAEMTIVSFHNFHRYIN